MLRAVGKIKDHEEHRRLDVQHHQYTLLLGRLYPAPDLVWRALRPRPDRRPTVLDLGTGSGSWRVLLAPPQRCPDPTTRTGQ